MTFQEMDAAFKVIGASLNWLGQRQWSDNAAYNTRLGWWTCSISLARTKYNRGKEFRLAIGEGLTPDEAVNAAIEKWKRPKPSKVSSFLPEISLEDLEL